MPPPKYPDLTPGVYRITQTSLEIFLKCGLRYWFEAETKHRIATVQMAIGSAAAIGAAHDNQMKLETEKPCEVKELIDVTVEGYEREIQDSEITDKKLIIDMGKDDAAMVARSYWNGVSPLIEPKSIRGIEEPILATTKGFEIAGTPDVITTDGIGDLKTGQPWNQNRVDKSRQLSCYALLHKARYGSYPNRVWIDTIYHRNRFWEAMRIWSSRQEEQLVAFIVVASKAIAAIKKGVALPAPEGAWWCCLKWCPFHRKCPAV